MNATLYDIEARTSNFALATAGLDLWRLRDAGSAPAELIVDEPGWRPYCVDADTERVIFAKQPPDIDDAQQVFVYRRQYERAERLLSVPRAALIALTADMHLPENSIFIFSTGRCGSTLLNQILNEIDGVHSLSEPDVYTGAARHRSPDNADALAEILRGCTLLHARSTPPGHVFGIKFRSQAILIADLVHRHFPDARYLFMYRDALSWANSLHRMLQRIGIYRTTIAMDEIRQIWAESVNRHAFYPGTFLRADEPHLYHEEHFAFYWLYHMQTYLAQFEGGIPFMSLTFDALVHQREATLKAILDFCALPPDALAQALRGFERDAQDGTGIDRSIDTAPLSDEQRARFLARVQQHPRLSDPYFVLPTA